MPSGIVMSSSSVGATQEAIEKVLTANGHEPDKPEVAAPVEPKLEDFESDEAFEKAQEEFEAKQEEHEEEEDDKAEKERLAALPKKSRRQRAVEKATKELKDELRKTQDRLAALEGKGGPEKKETAAAPAAPKSPKRADFATDAEYDDALFDYRYQVRRAKEQTEDARKQAEESQKSLNEKMEQNFTDYKASVLEFKEEHEDWDEVVSDKVHISQPVYYAIVDLGEDGPPVTYYLGQHPEEIDRLAGMTPYRAAIEVGRLADKLTKKPTRARDGEAERTKKPAPKRIPDPVRPVSTSATSSALTSREAAQNRNFKAFKAAQRKGA